MFFLALMLVACGPNPKETFELAEFEMLQTNYPHASKLYQEIIEKSPNSDYAATARLRLKEIETKKAVVYPTK